MSDSGQFDKSKKRKFQTKKGNSRQKSQSIKKKNPEQKFG